MDRREFIKSGAALGLTVAAGSSMVFGQAPAVVSGNRIKPVVISSNNGNYFKNGGKLTCIEMAFSMITKEADVLDSLLAGVNIVELDPEDMYVGYGGLPNADGVVQLDASCMHGPKKRAGGVAALEGVRNPSLVAKEVMNQTDHILLVGKGAQTFARNMGFKIEDDLNTEASRQAWLEWKRKTDPKHYLNPDQRSTIERKVIQEMAMAGLVPSSRMHGTINCDAINAKGEICGVTTTSGLPFKIPGRVGDSPIIGAGLYVDGAVGAAGSTGRGEANLYNLSSVLIVENLRRGMHPKDAGLEALRRIKLNTTEKRLLKKNGEPNFNINFYVLNAKGEHAGVAMYAQDDEERGYAGQTNTSFAQYSYCDENGARSVTVEPLLPGRVQEG